MSKKDVNMLEGPILPRMFTYTVPLLLSGVLQLLYNAADVVVVGNFSSDGEKALAAVGSTGSLTSLIVGLFLGLSVGSCVVLSRCLGANDKEGASQVVHTSILSGVIVGVVLAIVGIVFAEPLLKMTQIPDNVIDWAALYMRIYFAGLPASMIYNFGAAILRAKGNTRFPLLVLVFSGLVNVALNLLLIIVFRMDVAGVAVATVASQTLSAIMITVNLCKLDDCCRLFIRKISINSEKLCLIARVGIPAGLQSVVFSASNVLIQSSVNSLGKAAMAGNTAASNIDGFIYITQNSVYHAALAFTSQNMGARNLDRVKKIVKASLILVTAIGVVMGAIAYIFADGFLNLYAPGAEKALTRQNGMYHLEATALPYVLCGIMDVLTGLLRGLGSSVMPTIIAMIGACGFRILWIYTVFPIEQFHNMTWLFLSYPASWMLTDIAEATALFIVYKKVKKRMLSSQDSFTAH